MHGPGRPGNTRHRRSKILPIHRCARDPRLKDSRAPPRSPAWPRESALSVSLPSGGQVRGRYWRSTGLPRCLRPARFGAKKATRRNTGQPAVLEPGESSASPNPDPALTVLKQRRNEVVGQAVRGQVAYRIFSPGPRLRSFSRLTAPRRPCQWPAEMVIFPSFHRFNPSVVPSQTPFRSASTHKTLELDKPCLAPIVGTGYSRNRSMPAPVATQILPSRSSNIPSTELLVSPSFCVKRSILP